MPRREKDRVHRWIYDGRVSIIVSMNPIGNVLRNSHVPVDPVFGGIATTYTVAKFGADVADAARAIGWPLVDFPRCVGRLDAVRD